MGDITTFYPEFVPNQILTNTQLNSLREHLDGQYRLTRLRLTGMGIVCGFHYERNATTGAITIRKGYGITSDGDLLEQCADTIYTHSRSYADPDLDEEERIRYEPWRTPSDPKQQRDILELISKETMEGDDPPGGTTKLAGTGNNDRVLVLYLEREPVDLNSCLVTTCDNKGLNINLNVRALLVREADLTALGGCPDAPGLRRVPRLHTKRLPQNVGTAAQLSQAFGDIVNDEVAALGASIKDLFDDHALFLDIEPFTTNPLDGKLTGTQTAQYRYDALVDFASAYDEAALAAYGLITECCPSGNFPRHLMLGAIDKVPPAGYRHEFQPAPVRNVAHGDFERVRSLFLRLRAMVNGLDFGAHPASVSIQPSHDASHPLGRRALPFYFSGMSLDVWRPRGRCAVDPDWPWRRPSVAVGLDTDYAEASLLRIEGHVGKPCAAAAAEIEAARDTGNAEFELLCANFTDPAGAELPLRSRIDGHLEERAKLIEKLAGDVFGVVFSGGDGKGAVDIAKQIDATDAKIAKTSADWAKLRVDRRLHCDLGALANDYLAARGELQCLLRRLSGTLWRVGVEISRIPGAQLVEKGYEALTKGARAMLADRIVAAIEAGPGNWKDAESLPNGKKWSDLAGMAPEEQLKEGLMMTVFGLLYRVNRVLERDLPKSILAFDCDLFLLRFRDIVRESLAFWLWARILGLPFTGGTDGSIIKGFDPPLHEAEEPLLQSDLLVAARSCLHVRVATLHAALQKSMAQDLTLYRNLASRVDGLEHLGGVARGGTFVLVCSGAGAAATVQADLSLAGRLPCSCAVDPATICPPQLAFTDYRVVVLQPKKDGAGYEPAELTIHVELKLVEIELPAVTVSLPSKKSMLGADLAVLAAWGEFTYKHASPTPGTVDRFYYHRGVEDKDCRGSDLGQVLVVFTVKPVETGKIQGTVVFDENDQPADKAVVTILDSALSVSTGPTGHYEFTAVEPGHYAVMASLNDRTSFVVGVSLAAGGIATANLRLPPNIKTGAVKVRVRDSVAGTGLSPALVTLFSSDDSQLRDDITDALGNVIFPDVAAPDAYYARAKFDGYVSDASSTASLAAGGQILLEIFLKRHGVFRIPEGAIEILVANPVLPKDELIVKTDLVYNDRYVVNLADFDKAGGDPRVLKSTAYKTASVFMAETVTNPAITGAQLIQSYEKTSAALAGAAKQATGSQKAAYQEALEAVTGAFMDRLTLSNPTGLSAEASDAVKTASATMKGAGLNINTVKTNWSAGTLSGAVDLKSVNEVNSLLK